MRHLLLFIGIVCHGRRGDDLGNPTLETCLSVWGPQICDSCQTTTTARPDTCSCGVARSSMGRISGGVEATPHEFPWAVRLWGNFVAECGGVLVSPRVVLSAKHCVCMSCDFSEDEASGRVIYGEHTLDHDRLYRHNSIPIIEARAPEPQRRHSDFILLVLKESITWTYTVSPICLPLPGDEFGGKTAVAAGWGKTHLQSDFPEELRKVMLDVIPYTPGGNYLYTKVEKNANGEYMDPCGGDSGGPLMYHNLTTNKWTLIGTLYGGGYSCRTGNVDKDGGIWNNVMTYLNWIKENLEDLEQPICSN